MKLFLFLNIVLAAVFPCIKHVLSQKSVDSFPQVTLDVGTLRGFYSQSHGGRKIASFQSIPYVKQPMGRHRFKDSIEMGPWLGVYDATSDSPDCLQFPPSVLGSVTGTEDCLYINVYTPHVPTGTVVKPLLDVLVYIHGGGFMYYGSKNYSPQFLLDKDVVFVTFNYRLGPLGFLSTGDGTMPGNAGMKDQVMALRWVQRYISSFGGDPNKITLFGHSAGAASVHLHLLSPLSKGLFHKAIISGGSALNPWALAENLKEKTLALAALLGCAFQDSNLMIKCLRSRPASHIVAFSEEFMAWRNMPLAPWGPHIEPKNPSGQQNPPGTPLPFLEDDPYAIISSGQAHDVPILFTHAPYEGSIPSSFFVFDDASRVELSSRLEDLLPHVLDFYYTVEPNKVAQVCQKIKQRYLEGIDLTSKQSAVEPITQMISDRLFTSGIAESSMLHAQKYTSPVFAVRFSYKGMWSDVSWACQCNESFNGGAHYDEAAALIDRSYLPPTSSLDKEVQSRLVDLWYSFASTGKPEYGGTPVPEVKTALPSLTFLDISYDGNPSILTESDPGQTSFWKSLGLNEHKESLLATDSLHSEL